jgi:trimethylamine--corrinoid protein Co-methyltransferase
LFVRGNHAGWRSSGSRRIDQIAGQEVDRRLAAYEKPAIDPDVETALRVYITGRKQAG